MRIIAGRLGGRQFDSPGHRTHPMSDKIRGALFNILGDIDGLRVLDAFAGTGALGFEAISRGAQSVLAIDSDKNAQRTIAQNIKNLGLDQSTKLVKTSVGSWLETSQPAAFDIVLCDPPFHDLQENVIERLAELVSPQGTLVVSWPAKEALPVLPGLQQVESRSYGDAQLGFYQRITSL